MLMSTLNTARGSADGFDGQLSTYLSRDNPAALRVCHDFATLCLALIRFIQRIRDFDTAGSGGSNPHAPTNALNNLARPTLFSVAPECSIKHQIISSLN